MQYSKSIIIVLLSVFLINSLFSQESKSLRELEKNFQNPPQYARPQTWWHWMNGNVTSQGIQADLHAMKNIGMGGVQILEVGTSIPQGPVGTQDSLQMLMYKTAFETADKLGMEVVMHNCPGWSSSGGPWVEPKDAMKQIVWAEKVVSGNGLKQNIQLPQPFTKLGFYRDSYVLAFPTLKGEEQPAGKLATVISNGREEEHQKIADGDWTSVHSFTKGKNGEKGYVQFNFQKPYTARALTVVPAIKKAPVSGVLQASDDGKIFRDISRFGVGSWRSLEAQACVSFDAVAAKYFRVVFDQDAIIRDIELAAGPRIHNYPALAGYINQANPEMDFSREVSPEFIINPEEIIDLSAMMNANGTIDWEVPQGNWTIMRFGFTATSQGNIVPTISGQGLEIDKLSKKAVDIHFDAVFKVIEEKLGSVLGKKLHRTFIDSYEVGMQNWTDDLPKEFMKRKGYDIKKYMPALAGRIVGDVKTSERFLWDFRRNLADMFADNYVGHMGQRCREKGMLLSIEPYGDGPFDDFQEGSRADIPMGEFWSRLMSDLRRTKLPSMLAHTYGMRVEGNQIIEAESFTGAPDWTSWKMYPYAMKTQGDLVFCQGITRYVFHTYAHQPHPTAAPGMTMGQWGFHFDRNNGWFNMAGPWISYISRCQYLLQQGNIVADLCYFAGENSKVQCLFPEDLKPAPPGGYYYDIANAEVLLNRMSVRDGKIVLPDGVSYRLLIFPDDSKLLSVPVLKKIQELIIQGAQVVCNKPVMSPSLADDAVLDDGAYKSLVNEIWGSIDGKTVLENRYGKGMIYSGITVEEIFKEIDCKADFLFDSKNAGAAINYIHRKIEDTDLYFVANRLRRSEQIIGEFRVEGKQPEFWNPETGKIELVPVFTQENGITKVPVDFDEAGAVFVIFRKSIEKATMTELPKLNPTVYPKLENVINDFTISAWIKPETNIKKITDAAPLIRDDFALGAVVAPPAGDELYGDRHRAAGFVAGINGVYVFEKDSKSYQAVLVLEQPIVGWTHVTVVYKKGTPKLYLNGEFVKEGLNSGYQVHPGVGYEHKEYDVAYFEGDDAGLNWTEKVLSGIEIKALFEKGLPQVEKPKSFKITQSENRVKAEVFENGSYPNPFNGDRIQVNTIHKPLELSGVWNVTFKSSAKAPQAMEMRKLISWIGSGNDDLKYFSGTATYVQTFKLEKSMLEGSQKLYLDLGRVEVMAQVKLNGKDMGVLWKPPYRIEITNGVNPGKNTVEISVTNLWPNRLIGDAKLPTDISYTQVGNVTELPQWYRDGKPMPKGERSTFTTWNHYAGDEPLLESGLLGPVRIYISQSIKLD